MAKKIKKEEPKKVGRPTKYDPIFCETIIPIFEDGKGLASVAKFLGITRETLWDWRNTHEEFSNAVKHGLYLSQEWWEEKGREGLFSDPQGPKINSQLWFLNMKNRFADDWRDKQEIEQTNIEKLEIPKFGERK